MTQHYNTFGQPLGAPVMDWRPPSRPDAEILQGFGCRLEPLNADRHGDDLFTAFAADTRLWTYLPSSPPLDRADFDQQLQTQQASRDPQHYAICDASSGRALGRASYLRIDPQAGSIEVGWLMFSPTLQRSRLATAAMVLMMAHAFALGYRRYEWKCNALNLASRRAAQRLGFSFEGVFRQATVLKGRNRDTAWFSVLDKEWPALRVAMERWLAEDNFDAAGRQRLSLSALTHPLLAALDASIDHPELGASGSAAISASD